jgi:hypothetical protein
MSQMTNIFTKSYEQFKNKISIQVSRTQYVAILCALVCASQSADAKKQAAPKKIRLSIELINQAEGIIVAGGLCQTKVPFALKYSYSVNGATTEGAVSDVECINSEWRHDFSFPQGASGSISATQKKKSVDLSFVVEKPILCWDPSADNYLSTEQYCLYSNLPDPIYGCMDPGASNYNSEAQRDDGSCTYDIIGCRDSTAKNYSPDATIDGGCEYWIYGCGDPSASNYDPAVDYPLPEMCTYD